MWLLRTLACGKPERQIQRARTNEARGDEDDSKNAQDDSRQAREIAGEIQTRNRGGKQQPNHAIQGSHVLFHRFISFRLCLFID